MSPTAEKMASFAFSPNIKPITPTIELLANAWAGLTRDDKKTAAEEVARLGKLVYGDEEFEEEMASAVGGSGVIGEQSR
ncbi:hypothetical protein LTR53_013223 [Teratosphaeriaceae sp. CCFEE 6253]|nr:hypothetical protein LTR53_013223 [Teratosphaeriaceae sp. CCFEE 6253]